MILYRKLSSANRRHVALVFSGMSLMKIRIRWKTLPCGTPELTGTDVECLALDKDLMAPVAEEAGYPLQDISTNGVVSQLVGK